MQVAVSEGEFLVDAALVGELLDVSPQDVPALMREHRITSLCERGVDTDEGTFRLNFFYGKRRARLSIDGSGRVIRRSVVNVPDAPAKPQARRTTP
ncbi:MAG: DUF6522 family protein [Variibacter sp.]